MQSGRSLMLGTHRQKFKSVLYRCQLLFVHLLEYTYIFFSVAQQLTLGLVRLSVEVSISHKRTHACIQ
jgi:hypothetical protein